MRRRPWRERVWDMSPVDVIRITPRAPPTPARIARFYQHLSCSQPAFRCGEKVRRPCVEGGAFLLCPIMPLINSDYTGPTAQMIQHRLGDFETHTEALQPCRKRRRSPGKTNDHHRTSLVFS